MFKFIKNKFLFIVMISVITLVLLVVGAVTLYKDESLSFNSDGYILSTTTKKNAKYYFSANTKYKDNADDMVAFKDNKSKSVAVDPASFVHYSDGSIGYLKQGALVNLGEINSSIISYYNVSRNNLIKYDKNKYVLTSNEEDINVNAFVGRISDNKYIIAGSNLSLEVPNNNNKITGNYFEVLFIENGVVKIDNEDNSYQVTAQNSYIYVGNNIIINLGNEKIYYDGSAKMLLSQITINGDENINLDVVDNSNAGGGEGDGNGDGTGTSGDGNGSDGENTTGGNGENGEAGEGTGEESENEENNQAEQGQQGENGNVQKGSDSAKIEMISADVSSTMIDVSMQLNNASYISGELVAQLTNVLSNSKEEPVSIPAVNGTFRITKKALMPDTEYTLTIVETTKNNNKQYFQKTFKTKKLGISLEKQYSTENSLSYGVIFDEDTDVSRVRVSIYDNNGSNENIETNEYIVEKGNINPTIEFTGLNSNTSYSVSIDTVWIDNTAYSNVYTINRIDTTLKKTPVISDINVKANAEEVKFNIKLNSIYDPDGGIVSYIYKIYEADTIGLEDTEPNVVYSLTKNDSDAIELNLNEIDSLKTGVDYRCKIFAQYNDNEMIREVESDYSVNFLIKSKPNVTFVQDKATMNSVSGTITLVDANCTVPLNGRSCLNKTNNITLRYYKLGTDENSDNDQLISFNSSTLDYKMNLTGLSSDTTYIVKIYADYYDDDNVMHPNVQIGDSFYIKTDESEQLKLKIIGDNKSGEPDSSKVVTFNAMLSKPQDSTVNEEVASIKMNLYSGSYNVKDKLIGTYTMTDKNQIQDFFSNFTITNNLFVNSDLGNLDTLEKMVRVTNNSTGTLNGTYTVEIEKVLDSTGRNEIPVEDNIYTFRLTSSYYLDSRIELNKDKKYVVVTPIKKEELSEDEYTSLSKSVSELDDLNDDIIVGLTIENSLSDAFVDSAFTYEKAIVEYFVYNSVTKKEVKTISIDMGNKYQPKSQTIYLDSISHDDGKNFTRGYTYKVGYRINFTSEDGEKTTYTNTKLEYNNLKIDRQDPIISQYISTSSKDSITYRYSIRDVDSALYDNKLYYKLDSAKDYSSVNDELVVDSSYHDIVVPINEREKYDVSINRKNVSGSNSYIDITNYSFESEYEYNNENLYSLVDDSDNTLKIKFVNNDITNRAVAYRVTIKVLDDSGVTGYKRFFLASQLNKETVDTQELDEDGNPIKEDIKYISIDYANISRFMNHNLQVSVEAFYDSGLVGINQKFTNGFILENKVKGKYLNIYNAGVNISNSIKEESKINGMYKIKGNYEKDSTEIVLYNNLIHNYNNGYEYPYDGMISYDNGIIPNNVGVTYNLDFTNEGIKFNSGKSSFGVYNAKVIKVANLNTSSDTYRFNSIVPKVSLDTSGSTINSLKLNVISSGVYGQFIKNGNEHNKYYIDIYSDSELSNKLTTLTSDITINDDTVTASSVEYKNLVPNTTYYVTISAYVDGKLTRLYDESSNKGNYIVKTYEAKTLDANSILEQVNFEVKPVAYAGESSQKELNWRLKFKDTNNFKIRFELLVPTGEVNPDTEEIIYKNVNFDGSEVTGSCDNSSNGTSSNGYVNGCYIQVDKDKIADIHNKVQTFTFTGDDFVFGSGYYKLVVYAIPYKNNSYVEDEKLVLYQNDSLGTACGAGGTAIQVSGAPNYCMKVDELQEAKLNVGTPSTLDSGYMKDGGYYVEFTPRYSDPSFVMQRGEYVIRFKIGQDIFGIDNEDINKKCQYYLDYDESKGSANELKEIDNCELVYSYRSLNHKIRIVGLSPNEEYNVELSYAGYRNNYGYDENKKRATETFNGYIYTPINTEGINLGEITSSQNGSQQVILSYGSGKNMNEKIVKVSYTITLKGGSGQVSGVYALDNKYVETESNAIIKPNIFEITADGNLKLILDFKDNTNGFSLKSGNVYLINTQYWYKNANDEVSQLKKTDFTTTLDLR